MFVRVKNLSSYYVGISGRLVAPGATATIRVEDLGADPSAPQSSIIEHIRSVLPSFVQFALLKDGNVLFEYTPESQVEQEVAPAEQEAVQQEQETEVQAESEGGEVHLSEAQEEVYRFIQSLGKSVVTEEEIEEGLGKRVSVRTLRALATKMGWTFDEEKREIRLTSGEG